MFVDIGKFFYVVKIVLLENLYSFDNEKFLVII